MADDSPITIQHIETAEKERQDHLQADNELIESYSNLRDSHTRMSIALQRRNPPFKPELDCRKIIEDIKERASQRDRFEKAWVDRIKLGRTVSLRGYFRGVKPESVWLRLRNHCRLEHDAWQLYETTHPSINHDEQLIQQWILIGGIHFSEDENVLFYVVHLDDAGSVTEGQTAGGVVNNDGGVPKPTRSDDVELVIDSEEDGRAGLLSGENLTMMLPMREKK